MKSQTMTLAAVLFGIGCSHASPKPESPGKAIASAPPRASTVLANRQEPTHSSSPQARDDTADNAIYFDFDSALIRNDARKALQGVGKQLNHSHKSLRIEGNCDERGTTEYNIALGDRRAREAMKYLERLGVPERRMSVVSYGSERPKDPGHDESAWARNRRDDFKVQ